MILPGHSFYLFLIPHTSSLRNSDLFTLRPWTHNTSFCLLSLWPSFFPSFSFLDRSTSPHLLGVSKATSLGVLLFLRRWAKGTQAEPSAGCTAFWSSLLSVLLQSVDFSLGPESTRLCACSPSSPGRGLAHTFHTLHTAKQLPQCGRGDWDLGAELDKE